jgi:PPOX class probable F420-dependent enzyme
VADPFRFDPEAERRLLDDAVIWLTTVRADGQAQTSPVWFVWDGDSFLIYSIPTSPKVPNIATNHHVSLNLDGDGKGGSIVTIEGEATIDKAAKPVHEQSAYVAKYLELIRAMGAEAESFGRAYSTAIRVIPTRARYYP